MAATRSIKFCAVGDGSVGKTALCMSYAQNKFEDDYLPTVFDNYTCMVMVDGAPMRLDIWDTAGQEDYGRLRPLSYPGTDCFVLCFSVMSPTSLKNVSTWVSELQHYCPNAPIMLIGCKSDLRTHKPTLEKLKAKGIRPVSRDEAEAVAKKFNGVYVECSAKNGDGVPEVFQRGIKVATNPKPVARHKCRIL